MSETGERFYTPTGYGDPWELEEGDFKSARKALRTQAACIRRQQELIGKLRGLLAAWERRYGSERAVQAAQLPPVITLAEWQARTRQIRAGSDVG